MGHASSFQGTFLFIPFILCTHAADLQAQFHQFNDLWYKGVFPDSIIGYYHESPDMRVLDIRKVFHVENGLLMADTTFYYSELTGGFKNLEFSVYSYDNEKRLASTRVFSGQDQDWFPWLLDSIYYSSQTGQKDSSKSFAFDDISGNFQLEYIQYYTLASNGWDSIVIALSPAYDTIYRSEFSFSNDHYTLTSYIREQNNWIPVEKDSFLVFQDKSVYFYVIRESEEWLTEFLDSIYLNEDGRWGKSRQYYANEDGSYELVYSKEFYYPDQVSIDVLTDMKNHSCHFNSESIQQVRISTEPPFNGIVNGFDMMGNLRFSQYHNSGDLVDMQKYAGSLMVLQFVNSQGNSCTRKIMIAP